MPSTSTSSGPTPAKMGYLDFLDLVLQEELAVRDDRRFREGLRLSKLPHHKTLDDYDFSSSPNSTPARSRTWPASAFVEAKANVGSAGPPGVGKTHIAVALAVAACRAGFSIYFTSLDDMVRQLKAAEATGRLTSKLGTYCGPASSWWTRWATSPSSGPRRTWSSR